MANLPALAVMSDPDDGPRPFPDVFSTLLLLAATSLALLLTSRIWHLIHPDTHRRPTGFLFAALSSFHIRALSSPTQQQQSPAESALAADQKDRKSTRCKERRRRGKDPFRDLLKGGKKSKALFKNIKTADHLSPPSAGMPDLDFPDNDSTSSTSRSPSPEPPRDAFESAPQTSTESDDSGTSNASTTPVPSSGSIPDHCSSRAEVLPDPMTATENISSVSTVTGHAFKDSPSFPPMPAACADVRTPHARDTQPDPTSGSCAKFVRARTRLRVLRIDPNKSSLPSSTPEDSVASPSSAPALSAVPSAHSVDAPASSTPTYSRRSAPPSPSRSPPKDSGRGEANSQMQIVSMRNALEAARLREEQLRVAAEQASKERAELCWRWNEDANAWRMRESELQCQVNHLMQQLQAYVAVASFQPPNQPTSGFSSPTSPHPHMSPYHSLASFPLPPAIQPQNSASAPAHVRALLACAPMLTSHPPGFAAHASGSLYSGAGLGMSPLLWSGPGLCVPNRDPRHGGRQTPDSSASGSSSRGRRRRRSAENVQSASDESSLGDWDDGPCEEEDIFENNVLADAILKRPESLRKLSSSVG